MWHLRFRLFFQPTFCKSAFTNTCVTPNTSQNRIHRVISAALPFGVATISSISIQHQNKPKMYHSEQTAVEFPNMKIVTLPASDDNYMYLIIDKATKQAAVVDSLNPITVMESIRKEKVTLKSVLTTHHHWDHAGGNEKLVSKYATEYGPSADPLVVYGGDDRVDAITNKVGDREIITLGSLKINCLATPCHTLGHICYFVETSDMTMQKPAVFTGDTLFVGGCGRFFEGTPEQMYDALLKTLGTLPAETLVFCGHEYTVENFKFALYVDHSHQPTKDKLAWAEQQRAARLPTVPSTIGEELQTNIFMRVTEAGIKATIAAHDSITCMGKLRTLKNEFRPR